jgi:hypothetical protein
LCVTGPKVDDVTEVDGYISESEETGREKQRRGKKGKGRAMESRDDEGRVEDKR